MNLPPQAGGTGTLVLGRPTRAPATVVVPLTPARGTYPDGRQAWRRDVPLCWHVGTATGCGPTDIDTGTATAVATGIAVPGASSPAAAAPPGTVVTIATREDTSLNTFTTTANPPSAGLAYHRLLGTQVFNTGIGFYLTHSVAWDIRDGQLLVTPTAAATG